MVELNGKRVRVTFREDAAHDQSYLSYSLPLSRAQQIAHALLTTISGEVEPIEFTIDDSIKLSE